MGYKQSQNSAFVKDLNFLSKVLSKYLSDSKNSAFVFGSRADGLSKKFSDFDIGIEGKKISSIIFFDIKNEFEESDFPYTVDVVDFNDVSDDFKKIAKKKIILLSLKNDK